MFKNIGIVVLVTLAILIVTMGFLKFLQKKSVDSVNHPNVQAFLKMIRYAEGTAGPNGYRTMFTGLLFDNAYADHPRQRNCAGTLCSTAAGAYQFLSSTWDYVALRLSLKDFSPANQDLAATELIREKGALNDVIAGNFATAVTKVNRVWASLPGSPYGQPTKTLAQLTSVYQNEGGSFA